MFSFYDKVHCLKPCQKILFYRSNKNQALHDIGADAFGSILFQTSFSPITAFLPPGKRRKSPSLSRGPSQWNFLVKSDFHRLK